MLVTTAFELPGHRIVRHIGLVRGVSVRSRSALCNFWGNLRSAFGGRLGVYVKLADAARQEALDLMCAHAAESGANAVVGMRYDATEIMDGITEVLAYGTAVVTEPA